jgi:hypothetical protein
MDTSLLDAALRYAELDYAVFPCRVGAKQPLTPHGFQDATRDAAQIQAWWTRWPDANVAIAAAGLVVVDIDPQGNGWPHDPERAAQLAAAGAVSLTPRGGRHYVFRRPPDKAWRCSTGQLAPGVDLRTDGGYFLVPPSRTADGPYRWVPGLELDTPADRLPEPPAWLAALLNRTDDRGAPTTEGGLAIAEGQRNNALARLAGTMRRAGMTHAEILAALRKVNTDRCRPPLPEGEVERIAASVARYEPDQAMAILVHGLDAAPAPLAGVRFAGITSAELAAAEYALEYLIDGLLVRGQPGIIAGPKKTLKTNLSIDLALSLAEGGLFLGRFNVPGAVRVGVMSGESGAATIQETALRIAAAKGRPLAEYEKAIWCFDVPQLGHAQHMAALADFIAEHQLEVLILDPTYLMMLGLGDDAGNLFVVGRFLKSLGELSQSTGCTPLLCHHLRKTRAEPYEPPELEEIAWAGFQEFVRQWMLLGRRKRYDPADGGHHELWLSVGGSAGHSGLWALNIDEGTRQDPGGRQWNVEVLAAHEACAERAGAEAERAELRKERQRQSQRDRDMEAVLAAMDFFPEGETRNTLREAAGLSGRRFGQILAQLMARGLVDQCEITKPNGQRYTAFRRGSRTFGHTRTNGLSD